MATQPVSSDAPVVPPCNWTVDPASGEIGFEGRNMRGLAKARVSFGRHRGNLVSGAQGGDGHLVIEATGLDTKIVPTMYAAMLTPPQSDRTDISALEFCVSGGAAMPVEVMRAFEDRFGCEILEGYGLSETPPVASFNRRDRERTPGSIGPPVERVEMHVIRDDGRGPTGKILKREIELPRAEA